MWKLNACVVKIGTCAIDPGRMASPLQVDLKHRMGIGGGSTVTLIREGDRCLLVDTGYDREADTSGENRERNRLSLCWHLERLGVRETEVTDVFLTHFHHDHYEGIELFERARWCCHKVTLDECPSDLRSRFDVFAHGQEVIPRVTVVHTPGHTLGHASLIWIDADDRVRVAVAGDAILNLSWLLSGWVWRFNADFAGEEAAMESAQTLAARCDIVIPGHGEPFFVTEGIRSLLGCE